MPLLTVANVVHAYGANHVLDGATVSIEPGEKVGLVGRNGSGKSTLLKIILGQLAPDAGSMQLQRGARVGYLAQDPNLDPDLTLRDAAETAFADLHRLHVEMHAVYDAMATATPDELDRLMKKQARLESEIEVAGGYAIDHRIDATLHGLGLTDDQFGIQVRHLSGGQKGRLGLARLLLEAPDLLLLDEPTNHLDIDGREWLESFLADEYPGAVILVSHDRWLLDRVVSRIIETERGVVREYPGNYEKYVELREERMLTVARQHDKQMDRIRQEEVFIRKYKAGQRAKQARGRQSKLERFKANEVVERPAELKVMRLSLPKAPRSGEQVIVAEGLAKAYGDLVLFSNLDIAVARGERIGIIGPNGTGKTTLVRALLGQTDVDAGEVRLGSRLSIGYYSQLHENVDASLTIWQYLQSVIAADGGGRATEQQARDLAGAFLFSGDEQEKRMSEVSGGERSRAVLAGLVAGAHNVLVLDEPTNHLDIPSALRLEQALSRDGGYEGTLLLISHDRALLQATCDRLIVFDGAGGVRLFPGTYLEYQERRHADEQARHAAAEQTRRQAADAEKARTRAAAATPKKTKPAAPAPGRATPLAKWSLAQLEARIETLDQTITELDMRLMDPDVYSDGEAVKAIQAERRICEDEKRPLEIEWLHRAAD
ncbi:MAG: ABC-F family ATP-binding cassette domain-containing protein [Phycisphaerales bacterium]|nr:ABC-F family ATP-binding cassette domain-containing protein [Phycisphaerales bacterium]